MVDVTHEFVYKWPSVDGQQRERLGLNKLMTRFLFQRRVDGDDLFWKGERLKAAVRWTPRAAGQEADALANGVTEGFIAELRCEVVLGEIIWSIWPESDASR